MDSHGTPSHNTSIPIVCSGRTKTWSSPEDELQLPYLAERDLPEDSFATDPVPAQHDTQATPSPRRNSTGTANDPDLDQDPLADPDVYLVEEILKTRTRKADANTWSNGKDIRHNSSMLWPIGVE